MRVQEAIMACRETPDSFARPVPWRGEARAVDLANRIRGDRLSLVIPISETIAYFSEWHASPDDLLAEWELVTLKDISRDLGPVGR